MSEILPYRAPQREDGPPQAPRLAWCAVAVAVLASPIVTWPVTLGIGWIGWHAFGWGTAEKSRITFPIVWLLPVASFILTMIARALNPPLHDDLFDSPGRAVTYVALGINICTALLYLLLIGFVFVTALPFGGR